MSRPIFNLTKRVVSALPPTWPAKIYNAAIKVPGLKGPISSAIQRIAPGHIDMPEGRVIFDESDPVLRGSIGMGKYEQHTVSLFRSLVKPGMNVVDVGANLGYYTVIAAARVGPSGRVFAYEPDPHNFDLLRSNIQENSFKNVVAVPDALADGVSERKLYFADNQCTLSFDDKKGTGRATTVHTTTLDASLARYGSPKIDIIKMDIEGAEPIAFRGMKDTLARSPHATIFFEFYPNSIARLGYSPLGFLKEIAALGYTISVIDEDKGTAIAITDIQAFNDSFRGKEATQNLIAAKSL